MTGAAKRLIQRLANSLGYEIRRRDRPGSEQLPSFDLCLSLLLGHTEKLNIIQVGANDGMTNDPLHGFLKQNPARVRVILVEPQEQLIPYLDSNTSFLPERRIINAAIGPAQTLTLFRVAKHTWGDLNAPYAKGWPIYRAPTGITSAHREHVEQWLGRHYKGSTPPGGVIESVTVESLDINALLAQAAIFERPDVLQVDAEGFDDEVIYAASIRALRPRVINFELGNLGADKSARLLRHLGEHGYRVSREGIDALAVLTHPE